MLIQLLDKKSSVPAMIGAFTNSYGKSITDWIWFVGLMTLLYIIFLVALKMVCSIGVKELFLFLLITIPTVLFLSWLFALLPFNNPAYLFPINMVVINFLLLKISGHWDCLPDEGLPD